MQTVPVCAMATFVLTVDGQEVRTYEDMRDGMGSHELGEEVTLRVSRASGETDELVVNR